MAEDFDPYYKWLGISPTQRPIDLYTLLGLPRFEADPEVIAVAADQRMAHLRSFGAGPRAALAQRLLNELSRARVVLLQADKKAAYDTTLRAATPPPPPPGVPAVGRSAPPPVPRAYTPNDGPEGPSYEFASGSSSGEFDFQPLSVRRRSGRGLRTNNATLVGLLTAAVAVVAAAGIWFATRGDGNSPPEHRPAAGSDKKPNADHDVPSPPKTAQTPSAVPKVLKTVDLLAAIDPSRHALQGKVTMPRGSLLLSEGKPAAVDLPIAVPSSYELTLHATRIAGDNALGLGLVVGNHPVVAVIDGARQTGHWSGLSLLGGEDYLKNATAQRKQVFTNDVEVELTVVVKPDAVKFSVNGEKLLDWRGDAAQLAADPDWGPISKGRLSVRAWESTFSIRTLRLKVLADESKPAVVTGPAQAKARSDFLQTVGRAVEQGRLQRTEGRGGDGGGPFEVVAPAGLLVGLEVELANFAGHKVLSRVAPIFLTDGGIVTGQAHGDSRSAKLRVEAKEGYAVGGLNVRAGARVDAVQVIFMRYGPDGLDPSDSYESGWLGGRGTLRPPLRSEGAPVVGIHGGIGKELDRLGLVLAELESGL